MYVSLKRTLAALRLVSKTRKWIDDYEEEKESKIFNKLRPKLDNVDDALVQIAIAISGKRTFTVIRKACSICRYYTSSIDRQMEAYEQQLLSPLSWSLTNLWQAEAEVLSEVISKSLSTEEALEVRTIVMRLRKKVEANWPDDIPMPSRTPQAAA